MAKLLPGGRLPRFRFDTPYAPQQRIAALYEQAPLFLVFLNNFGHPVTRRVIQDYLESWNELEGCRLACVVRSHPQLIAEAIPEDTMPFTIICDPDGELYRHFEVASEASIFRYGSLKALGILQEAKKAGYRSHKGKALQLPLTLLVDTDGTILMAHYGKSLTDLPEDCAAMSEIAEHALPVWEAAPEAAAPEEAAEAPADAEERKFTQELPTAPALAEETPEEPDEQEMDEEKLDSEGNPYTLESLFGIKN